MAPPTHTRVGHYGTTSTPCVGHREPQPSTQYTLCTLCRTRGARLSLMSARAAVRQSVSRFHNRYGQRRARSEGHTALVYHCARHRQANGEAALLKGWWRGGEKGVLSAYEPRKPHPAKTKTKKTPKNTPKSPHLPETLFLKNGHFAHGRLF